MYSTDINVPLDTIMNISKKNKSIKSAYDSTTFDTDVSIHVDRIVGSASISPSGRDVVLASTDGLDIIDLDSPLNPPRHLRNGLPWLVADVQWSPFAARDYWVVSTANQKALVWNLNKNEDANGCVEHTLSAHKRAITDINFSAHHPDVLATCAVDGNVHVWDLRRPKKPVITFTDWFGGATQIKWNRQDPHISASSHDRWLRIWDDRKGAAPIRSINAHVSKIYGVDWNRTEGTRVVTCSLDKTIKFWDYHCEIDKPERIIHTDFPVWRARHTPFGYGLLAMPQDSPGDLYLYHQRPIDDTSNDTSMAVHTFRSHGDFKVKEFLWRGRGSITEDGLDNREFQLVSWGEDNELRLHTVDPSILGTIGHEKGSIAIPNLNVTRKGAAYKTFRDVEKIITEKKAPTITGPQPTSSKTKANLLMMYATKKFKSHKGRPNVRGIAMKTKAINIEEEKDQKKIGWMSGIKFSKPESDVDSQRRFSFTQPDFDDDRGWDGHESLHDEIIRIHKQLPSIEFDDIDMDKRTIIVSINGPWADDGNCINVTLTLIFPEDYPELKSPFFLIGKNSLMSISTYFKLKRDVQKIADSCIIRTKGCLEMVLRYLLGEFDLEASTYFKDIVYDADYSLTLESSSDEEAELSTNTSTALYHELDPNAPYVIPPANHNANVPLPRLCGARFSINGLLVCFFPPKEDKVKSLLATLTAQNNTRARERPYFESFARLKNIDLLGQKAKSISLASEGHGDSDESFSDTSNASDSDYSTQYSQPIFLRYLGGNVHRSIRRGPPTSDSQISSGACTTIGTTTSRRGVKPKNIIAFYSVADILPSKMELAKEYAIFGDGLSVCKHNTTIAEKHGYRDLADVWRYIAMILYNKIHVKSSDQTYLQELSIATTRHAARKDHSNDSCSVFGVSYNINTWFNDFLGRIRWESNPLAVDVIYDLFIHFERQADIQMLAMLSCVLTEPLTEAKLPITPIKLRPLTSRQMKESRFSLNQLLADGNNYTVHDKHSNPSSFSAPKLLRTPSAINESVCSLVENNAANPSHPHGDMPPLSSAQISLESNSRHPYSQTTNHEISNKTSRASNSVGLSTFAAGLSRFTSSSSSPPKPASSRKKISPVEHILSSLAPSVISWGNTTATRSSKSYEKANPSVSEDHEESKQPICTGIRVDMINSRVFGGKDYIRTPILHAHPASMYHRYRAAYAELLFLWDDPIGRLEMLKFNAYSMQSADVELLQKKIFTPFVASPGIQNPAVRPAASITQEPLAAATKEGLVITGYCIRHESRLEPLAGGAEGGAVGRCDRCTIIQRQLRCTICLAPVSSIFSPCLSCGCVSHLDCLAEFHAEGYTYCPGGCECNCVVYAGMGIVENWEVMMGSFLLEGKGDQTGSN